MAKTTARGYGNRHQQLRARLAPVVAAGGVRCWRPECPYPGKLIQPWHHWDLGHDDNDRSRYVGPEHRRCNRAAGARKTNRLRRLRRKPRPASRVW